MFLLQPLQKPLLKIRAAARWLDSNKLGLPVMLAHVVRSPRVLCKMDGELESNQALYQTLKAILRPVLHEMRQRAAESRDFSWPSKEGSDFNTLFLFYHLGHYYKTKQLLAADAAESPLTLFIDCFFNMFSSNICPPLFRVLQGRREFSLTCLFFYLTLPSCVRTCHYTCFSLVLYKCPVLFWRRWRKWITSDVIMLLLAEMHWRDDFNEGNLHIYLNVLSAWISIGY